MVPNIARVKGFFPKISDFIQTEENVQQDETPLPAEPVDQGQAAAPVDQVQDAVDVPEEQPDFEMGGQSLLSDFITETGEHLEETERNLLLLGQQPGDVELMNEIFRSIHTIKGSSEYLGLERIAELSHKLESLLDLLRRGEREADKEIVELLIGANDRLGQLVSDLDEHQAEQTQIDDLVGQLATLAGEVVTEAAQGQELSPSALDGVVQEAVYGDENDEELFGIFLDQLKDGLQGLQGEITKLEDEEAAEPVLEQCIERLTTLRSSANYMGYEKLKDHYEGWIRAVGDMREQIAQGNTADLGKFVQEVMVSNIARVKGFFPKISDFIQTEESVQQDETPLPAEPVDQGQAAAPVDQGQAAVDVPEEQPDFEMGGQSLLSDFITETGEHLEETERNLLRWEQRPDDVALMNEIFRSIHTVKGSSEYLGLERIAELSHKLESLLDLLRRGEREANKEIIDLLIGANDRLGQLVSDLDQHQAEQTQIDDLVDQIEGIVSPQPIQTKTPEEISSKIVKFDQGQVSYDESYDQELFEIFLNQLNACLERLRGVSEQLVHDNDAAAVLVRCEEDIDHLRSSANYMEYEELKDFYDQWLFKVKEARSKLSNGEDLDLRIFTEKTMLANIAYVEAIFKESQDSHEVRLPVSIEADNQEIGLDENVTAEPSPSQIEEEPKHADDFSEDPNLIHLLESAFDARLGNDEADRDQSLPIDIEGQLLSEHEESYSEKEFNEDILASSNLESVTDTENSTLEAFILSDKDTTTIQDLVSKDEAFEITRPYGLPDSPPEMEPQASESDQERSQEVEPLQETEPLPVAPQEPEMNPSTDFFYQAEPEAETSVSKPSYMDRRGSSQLGRRKTDKFRDRMLKQSIRVDAGKIDYLMNQVGELVVSRAGFSQIYDDMRELQLFLKQTQKLDKGEMQQVKNLTSRISDATLALGRVTAELQENVMKVRMLPISQLFSRYPRLVHDLVRNTNKKVNLDVRGEDTELDKMVIEQIADPLVHVIRNAVDHGIEEPSERQKRGKPEEGILKLEAYHEGNYVVIEISDDGRGLDVKKIQDTALKNGFITQEELDEMDEEEILSLIMQPGFSTADQITHTSGRGVGMDVVKDNIDKLSGSIDIFNITGAGARFRIKIPLTLAIIPALMVTVADEIFTIPLGAVDETIHVTKDQISTIEGLEVIYLRELSIPLIRLAELFKMKASAVEEECFVVIVNAGDRKVGFIVDSLRGREEVVIKPLEDYLQEKSGFSGATILGDGGISLILDVFELVNLSINQHSKKTSAIAV
jgi:two-component system chemotaxis sensor kinase CheA